MLSRRRLGVVLLVLGVHGAALMPAIVTAADAAVSELLRSARLWETSGRYDLALQTLQKARLTQADSALAQLRIGLLDVRADQLKHAADVLAQMQVQFPQTFETQQLQIAYRVATQDRMRMASIRRLLEIQQFGQAMMLLRELFPEGPPGFDLGLEYFQVVAKDDASWAVARDGFEALVRQDPENPRYRLALARHLLRQPQTRAQGVEMLKALSREQDVTTDAAATALANQPSPSAAVSSQTGARPDDAQALARQRQLQRNRRFLAAPDLGRIDDAALRQRIGSAHRELDQRLRALDPGSVPTSAARLRENVVVGDSLQAWPLARLQSLPRDVDGRRRVQHLREQALGLHWWRLGVIAEGQGDWSRAQLQLELALLAWDGRLYAAGDAMQALGVLDPTVAEVRYREALDIEPDSTAMRSGLVGLLAAQGRMYDALVTAGTDDSPEIRAKVLAVRAQRALDNDQTGAALRDFEAALQLNPGDAWLRYDLARLYRRLGLAERGRSLMNDGVIAAANKADARYAQALYLSLLDDHQAALDALQAIPPAQRSDSMNRMLGELQIPALLDQAVELRDAQHQDQADQVLMRAQTLARRNPQQLLVVARAWVAAGQRQRAYALLSGASGVGAKDRVDLQLALGRLYAEVPEREALEALLAALGSGTAMTPEQTQEYAQLQQRAERLAIEQLRDAGQTRQALARVEAALQQTPQSASLQHLRADLLVERGRPRDAVALYMRLLDDAPDDIGLRFDYAGALAQLGQRAAAIAQLDQIEAQLGDDDRGYRQLLFWRRYGLDDYAGAQRVINTQLQRYPNDPEIVAASAELARARGRSDAAVSAFRQSADLLVARGDEASATRAAEYRGQAERIASANRGWIAAGFDAMHKPGSDGVSKLNAVIVPVEARFTINARSHWFALADGVDLSAGTLPADYDAAGGFGTVYAAGPSAVNQFPAGYAVEDRGVAVGVGYRSDRLRIDIGSTPLGFEVEDVVGGAQLYFDVGRLDLALDVSRRPVTSSLLSYAGIVDPVSGETWGGVRSTGVGVRAGRYEADYSFSGSLEYRWLQGRNVLDNRYAGARLAADHRIVGGADWELSAGLTLNYWHYDENQRYYSFGHGGYYSPQRYVSVSLPLDLRGRADQLSYVLRGAVTYSSSREDAALVYPTDPALQAAAQAQPDAPGNFSAPVYRAGGGDGVGLSAQGAIEYGLTPEWFLGARAQIDRSDYYEPESFGVYVRREFTPRSQPERPPRAPALYSDF
ncbi:cellulose biosynthesis protein BcsC [Sinimarinibacterium sp. CAU 1509]|uniref:cellulose biosynthesis protein BcsC n=1 Tax=Sinimarinibacterium sp. CAU 1509 TaxID=2562283 RepID=UPI00146EA4C5|nr:cellulose biosynthesis protein BcsC [Sinimarinibacterium sp. CAU 1509]